MNYLLKIAKRRIWIGWAACLGTCLIAGCDKPPVAVPAEAGDRGAAAVSPPAPAIGDVGAPRGDLQAVSAAKPPETAGTGQADPAAKSAPDGTPAKSEKPRERLFQGWPKPQLALFITGQQHGYIEPCGCTGLTNQKGGLARRFTCRKSLVDRGWDVIPLDAGNQVSRSGRQSEIKFQITTEGLRRMGYQAVGLGPDDLRLSSGELVAITAQDGNQPSLFVCANAAVIDRALTPRFLVLEAGGKKVGVTAVLGVDRLSKIANDEVLKEPPEKALREVWPQLQRQNCDLYVLLAQASIEECQQLARSFPHFDIVVTTEEVGEPTHQLEEIPQTKSRLLQVGVKGMYVGVLGLFADGGPRLRYQRVPLDDRFEDSREMLELLASYQDQLKAAGLDGLGVKPLPFPDGRAFVGSKACDECHDEEYAIWKKSKHAHALDTLIRPGERSEIPRHFDPECLSCHVVGWNPQKYFPYVSGYLGVEETPKLHHVGCENCHGPGAAHVQAELGKLPNLTDALRDQLREETKLPLKEAEKKCIECHDLDNSINFHLPGAFDKYWKEIEH